MAELGFKVHDPTSKTDLDYITSPLKTFLNSGSTEGSFTFLWPILIPKLPACARKKNPVDHFSQTRTALFARTTQFCTELHFGFKNVHH